MALCAPHFFARTTAAQQPPGPVVLGLNVAQSGPYADEGADELRAFELAVQHINGEGDGGMLNTMRPLALTGAGILGRRVEFVTGDTQTRSDAARASALTMIEKDGVSMISGGSSSGVAVAVQALCQEAGIIFMAGLTHSNDTTGKDRTRNGFRHFFNSNMSAAALGWGLRFMYGNERRAYYLTADYNWGYNSTATIQAETEALGWTTVQEVLTPLTQTDFTPYIAPVAASGADVLVLSHYGGNLVNSITSAARAGMLGRQVNGRDFVIACPLVTDLMLRGIGSDAADLVSTMNWHWSLQDAGSQAFVRSFGTRYGFPPSSAAHTCYVQTLLYADACQRAGSTDACAVVEALEDFEFDGLGNGSSLYRAEDHQCIKSVPLVKGRPNPENAFDLAQVIDFAPLSAVAYDPSLLGGSLGDCNSR
ncbi:MAG: ABC transporter substrate-binding protein [Pseudomonadota bacterium]